ncbi:TPA: Fic family protein [Neisseria gonorrhoeae]
MVGFLKNHPQPDFGKLTGKRLRRRSPPRQRYYKRDRLHPFIQPAKFGYGIEMVASRSPKIENPFDRAVYLHNNLAYLRYFKDCNKRTARNCMTLTYCQKLYDLVADALRFFSLRILPRQLSRLCRGCRSLLRNRRLRFIQEIFYFGIRKYRK